MSVPVNTGSIDRVLRIALGVLIIAYMFFSGTQLLSPPGIVLLILSTIAVGTALFGFCPLYKVLGLRTCKL